MILYKRETLPLINGRNLCMGIWMTVLNCVAKTYQAAYTRKHWCNQLKDY